MHSSVQLCLRYMLQICQELLYQTMTSYKHTHTEQIHYWRPVIKPWRKAFLKHLELHTHTHTLHFLWHRERKNKHLSRSWKEVSHLGLGDERYHIEIVVKFMSIMMMSSGHFYSIWINLTTEINVKQQSMHVAKMWDCSVWMNGVISFDTN